MTRLQPGPSAVLPHSDASLPVAALLVAAGRSVPDAVEAVVSSADDLGAPGTDAHYGAGLLDIPAALAS